MTVTDKTAQGQTDTIAFELDLRHAPEKVWRALTEPGLLARWLLPTIGFELAPGASFQLKTDPYPGWDGTVNCKMLAIEPRKTLSWAWVVGGDLALDTVLTFTLEPTAEGTHLSIVQSGFTSDQKRESGGARYGWKTMGGKLIDLLERMP